MSNTVPKTKTAIILTGGGARAAYQVGVLKAIAELLPQESPNPFHIISGTSAGAINAASLACYAENFRDAVSRILLVWANFRANHVFRTDVLGIAKTGAHWLASMMLGGLGFNNPQFFLDRRPLRNLLERYINSDLIQKSIENGFLHAVCVTASGYASHQSVSFFQGHPELQSWVRSRRVGARSKISIDHLMASSAIPFVFEPVRVHREYFGDGSMRQIAPISPVLHLGAEKILIIGNRQEENISIERISDPNVPSLGEIAGHALDSIFLDSLEADLERLQRINRTVDLIPHETRKQHGLSLRKVEVLVIGPSQDFSVMADRFVKELPLTIRFLMRGLGASKHRGSSLASYLLFERGYTRALIDLGYEDTMKKKDEIKQLLDIS